MAHLLLGNPSEQRVHGSICLAQADLALHSTNLFILLNQNEPFFNAILSKNY